MPSMKEAVAFTDALLSLRTGRALQFSIGEAKVHATPHRHLLEADAEGLKWSRGRGLKAIRFDLRIQDVGKEREVPAYLAVGDWSEQGSHYLIVYIRRSRTAQEFNLLEGLVRASDGHLHLWTSTRLFPTRPPEWKERLISWMEQLGRGRADDGRLWVGSDADRGALLVNVLTLALLKEHMRGKVVLNALAEGLQPNRAARDVAAAATVADGDALEEDEDWEGLRLTPPRTVSRKRRTGGGPKQVDFSGLEEERKALGDAAERLVLQFEQSYLREHGKPSLAGKVKHVSDEEGDGAGYDILSYTLDGKPLYIEVKATRGGESAPFFLTAKEWAMARQRPSSWRLYRLYEFDPERERARFFIIRGRDVDQYCALEPALYRVRLKRIPPAVER